MIRYSFLFAFRNLAHQKTSAIINISGLVLGFTCFLLLFMAFQYELSYDRFHSKANRIYRINTHTLGKDGIFYNTGSPFPMASAVRNDVTGLEKVVSIYFVEDGSITIDRHSMQKDHYQEKKQIGFVEADYFNVFDYQWISGDSQKALSQPNSVVLSEEIASKYFGGDALNKIIMLENNLPLKVTGVVRDSPANTVLPFKLFVSFQSLKDYLSKDFNLHSWQMIASHMQTYVLLPEQVEPQQVAKQLPDLISKYVNETDRKGREHSLQPLHEIHVDTRYESTNQTPVTAKASIWLMLLIGTFILLIACINYINLTTAHAIKRSKEVGLRKLLGSSRIHLFIQFISETLIITLSSMVLASILAALFLPWLNELLRIAIPHHLLYNLTNLAIIIGCILVVSLVAGIYPASLLSGFELTGALKNKIKTAHVGDLSFRRGLVMTQFFISQLLIISTIVIIHQVEYFTSAYVGFDKEAIITLSLPDSNPTTLRQLRTELLGSTAIQQVSFAFNHPLSDYQFTVNFQYKASGNEDKYPVELKPVDSHYINTYGLTLLAGQNLNEHDSIHSFIVNEALVRKMGLSTPQDAIGKVINLTPGDESPQVITGVVADFHSQSLHQAIGTCILLKIPSFLSTAGIKVNPKGLKQAIQEIEKVWSRIYPDKVFAYQFLDQTMAGFYQKEIQLGKLLKIVTSIAILIGCLGVYGLVLCAAQGRRKEIGIRKTLGAGVINILLLLTKESILLILLASLLAWPLAWYSMNKWLENFSYHITLSGWIFVFAGGVVVLIAFLTISFQAIKAALANPIHSLRNE
ncbi:ABC transporter permease [Rhodocytophaga aerolata]|uniref:ABC transporter permease n=1 Tax=Rhodocytophaga aerolata TaxID=455078 RepID=A0ABT8RIG3_9BACT|nr:ABC transporter permease [Rhodocytophaga aerolata]MDO1451897.1 ABC transporter permease [Rhodocytophaga aerolata]